MFRVKRFKNAGNILPTTPHHMPGKLNHQQHCSVILRSDTMHAFGRTRIHYHVMACYWTFTLGWMSPLYTFTKCFIPTQDEPFWVHSVYEDISKILIVLLCTVLKVSPYMCYYTFTLSSIISFFLLEDFVWWSSWFNYLHPAFLCSLLHLITPCPQYCSSNSNCTCNKRWAYFSTKNFFCRYPRSEDN